MKRLDVHTHLGDILYGKNIIHKQHQELKETYYEKMLQERGNLFLRKDFHYPGSNFDLDEWKQRNPLPDALAGIEEEVGIEEAFTARNFSASLKEMQKSMKKNRIDYCAVMSVLPQVGFEDIKAASLVDNRIIPFTSIDFSLGTESGNKLLADVKNGARGLKIHPIIQNVRLDAPEVLEALERWEESDLPVLPHIGVAEYFPPDKAFMDTPQNGEIEPFLKIVKMFPHIKFIAGHGGNESWKKLLETCVDDKNVYVDTSMSTPESIQSFRKEWGADRMLFASDWPWLRQETAVELIEQEINDDNEKEKIYFRNACKLLKLDF